jgi:hypothetical protein
MLLLWLWLKQFPVQSNKPESVQMSYKQECYITTSDVAHTL